MFRLRMSQVKKPTLTIAEHQVSRLLSFSVDSYLSFAHIMPSCYSNWSYDLWTPLGYFCAVNLFKWGYLTRVDKYIHALIEYILICHLTVIFVIT